MILSRDSCTNIPPKPQAPLSVTSTLPLRELGPVSSPLDPGQNFVITPTNGTAEALRLGHQRQRLPPGWQIQPPWSLCAGEMAQKWGQRPEGPSSSRASCFPGPAVTRVRSCQGDSSFSHLLTTTPGQTPKESHPLSRSQTPDSWTPRGRIMATVPSGGTVWSDLVCGPRS